MQRGAAGIVALTRHTSRGTRTAQGTRPTTPAPGAQELPHDRRTDTRLAVSTQELLHPGYGGPLATRDQLAHGPLQALCVRIGIRLLLRPSVIGQPLWERDDALRLGEEIDSHIAERHDCAPVKAQRPVPVGRL